MPAEPDRGFLARLTHLWWGRLPAAVHRLSPPAALCLTDGTHLATWPPLAALGPPVALAAGLALGWSHPGFPLLWSQSVLFVAGVAAVGVLSAALGAWLVAGFAVGDFFLADHGWPAAIPAAAPGVFGGQLPELLRLRLPLVIGYLLLLLVAARLPVFAKTLLANTVGGRSVPMASRPLAGAALLGAHALVTNALVWAWVQAVPVLIRPRFTWLGALAPPGSAYVPLQVEGNLVVAVVVIASVVRLTRQLTLASRRDVQAKLDGIQEPVLSIGRTGPPGAGRRWVRAVGAGLATTALACGILASTTEAVLVFGGAVVLGVPGGHLVGGRPGAGDACRRRRGPRPGPGRARGSPGRRETRPRAPWHGPGPRVREGGDDGRPGSGVQAGRHADA